MDIYIVLDGPRVVGASTRLQGAELIRSDESRRLADNTDWCCTADKPHLAASHYAAMRIENVELRDMA